MTEGISFTVIYEGGTADDHEIDFYDISIALIGFQRSLALTTHLVLNGEVITQAPALRGARIFAQPPEEGSWKLTAVLGMIGAGIYQAGTAPRDTPLGHLVSSAYDYVISETLGFHVDYEKSLGQAYKEMKGQDIKRLPQSKFDAVIEKCEVAIREMHRPIVFSETATTAQIIAKVGGKEIPIQSKLNRQTYDYIEFTKTRDAPSEFEGRVSSYNVNTFKGRIFIPNVGRPIPFKLAPDARDSASVHIITQSLAANAQSKFRGAGDIGVTAFENLSRTDRLKSLYIVEVNE